MTDFQYTAKVFDEYEKRFAKARLEKQLRDPADKNIQKDILREAREMLCIDRIPTPTIKIIEQKQELHNEIAVRIMQFRSWEHCYGEASLFLPKKIDGKYPVVVICNGHSPDGRLGYSYQQMAFRLAKCGIIVLMSDNLGQGTRKEFGHTDAHTALCVGITLQGMIVSESNAWIEWLIKQPFTDCLKIGVCGNSGGGTLSLFLLATNPKIAAVASCGYPSEFSYVHQKEKKHCCCNLLKGCAHKAEMWEIYGTFAPKPLMICSGKWDDLFPVDMVRRTIRKVRTVYESVGAAESFESVITATKHSWEREDCEVLADFFCRHFGLEYVYEKNFLFDMMDTVCRFKYLDDAVTTNQVAEQIVGTQGVRNLKIEDVYPPCVAGSLIDACRLTGDIFPASPLRILAQMEIALKND